MEALDVFRVPRIWPVLGHLCPGCKLIKSGSGSRLLHILQTTEQMKGQESYKIGVTTHPTSTDMTQQYLHHISCAFVRCQVQGRAAGAAPSALHQGVLPPAPSPNLHDLSDTESVGSGSGGGVGAPNILLTRAPSGIPTDIQILDVVFGAQVPNSTLRTRPPVLPFSTYAPCRLLDVLPDNPVRPLAQNMGNIALLMFDDALSESVNMVHTPTHRNLTRQCLQHSQPSMHQMLQ